MAVDQHSLTSPAERTSERVSWRTIPTSVDQFRLLRPLGWSGVGVVYEAVDMSLGRWVAIKLIPRGQSDGAELPRMLGEAQRAGHLHHPNVVSVYGTGAYPDGVYLVMELVHGWSLQSLVSDGPVPWREATKILLAACAGLGAVHARGIIHGDLKPTNLLRSHDGTVKVTDFGLAHWPDPLKRSPGLKQLAATLHYASPEQCRQETCDKRTDIYSLGAIYHTLLTGRTPYPGVTPREIVFDHCLAPVPDPRVVSPQIPSACAEIVLRAMSKKPSSRHDSAHALSSALQAVLDGDSRCQRWRRSLLVTLGLATFLPAQVAGSAPVARAEPLGRSQAWRI